MVLTQPQVVQVAGKEGKFSEEVLDEYKRAKQLQEKDNGTTVSWAPIVEGLGLPVEEAEAIAAKTDGNGLLNVPETLTALAGAGKIAQDDSAKEALAAFAFLGNNKTDTIAVEQLRHILGAPGQKLSDTDLDSIIKSLSKDGQVNYRDLIAAMISCP